MSTAQVLQALNERREHIARELAALGDVQSGSLAERYRRCGKPTCHCATDGGPGHGPSWSLTRRVDGKTVTRIIAPSEVPAPPRRASRGPLSRGLPAAVAGRLNADRSDEKDPRQPCACGARARYAGRRPKTFTTALGEMELRRAWYHCENWGAGFSPRDRALGLERTSLSPAALRMTGLAAARVSFAEGSELLRELAGLDIDAKLAERQAEALGREIADDERQVVEPEPATARTLYLGLDGTGVPVRQTETRGRRGKQPDGSAKTREAKIVAVWSADALDQDGRPVRDPGSVTYGAAIETIASRETDPDPSPFAGRALREAERRCFDEAPRRAVLGDGALWIWNWADEYAPGAIQIVDIFHAKGHLFDVAKAI